ncbi:MAG TPA: D-glucuronyl C5-epimerase family protein [Chloroflexia bacterium]
MRLLLLGLIALLLGALAVVITLRALLPAQANTRTPRQLFSETGKTVSGEFLAYWRAHDATVELGPPLSNEFNERGPADGRIRRVQYFGKAKLTLYPDKPAPNNVALSHIDRAGYQELVADETWPLYQPPDDWKLQVRDLVSEWKRNGGVYTPATAIYNSFGAYLDSAGNGWEPAPAIKFDADGLPMVKYGEAYYYNPTTIAQYSLSMYGKVLSGEDTEAQLLKAGEKLLALQDEDGAFRYHFSWTYYVTGQTFEPGWVSGIAQGQALSAFARLYHLTGDKRYLDAGDKALRFLLKPVAQGGLTDTLEDLHPSLARYVFFQEYVANPASYTFNGYIIILLGLYDWSNTPSGDDRVARDSFDKGLDSLRHILPYYDIGGISSYDMAHVTYNRVPSADVNYHVLVLNLLSTLESIQHDEALEGYRTSWETFLKP